MEFPPLPYLMTKDLIEVEMMIQGDRRAASNIFAWKKVILDLSGTRTYDLSVYWVYKKGVNNKVPVDLYFYIDDGRPTT